MFQREDRPLYHLTLTYGEGNHDILLALDSYLSDRPYPVPKDLSWDDPRVLSEGTDTYDNNTDDAHGDAGGDSGSNSETDGDDDSKRHSKEKEALVDMAKGDKKKGVTRGDMKAYEDLNKGLPDPFPSSKVRVDEGHPGRAPHSEAPHGHVGPVGHIPIRDP